MYSFTLKVATRLIKQPEWLSVRHTKSRELKLGLILIIMLIFRLLPVPNSFKILWVGVVYNLECMLVPNRAGGLLCKLESQWNINSQMQKLLYLYPVKYEVKFNMLNLIWKCLPLTSSNLNSKLNWESTEGCLIMWVENVLKADMSSYKPSPYLVIFNVSLCTLLIG